MPCCRVERDDAPARFHGMLSDTKRFPNIAWSRSMYMASPRARASDA